MAECFSPRSAPIAMNALVPVMPRAPDGSCRFSDPKIEVNQKSWPRWIAQFLVHHGIACRNITLEDTCLVQRFITYGCQRTKNINVVSFTFYTTFQRCQHCSARACPVNRFPIVRYDDPSMYPIQQSRWIWLLGRGARTRPFARGGWCINGTR